VELWGFTLWLTFDAAAQEKFSATISRIAELEGLTPFEPHLTLCGGIPALGELRLVALTHSLASLIGPLDVKLGDIRSSDHFYRCLFADVEKGNRLERLHRNTREMYAGEDGDYHPHVSLAYGSLDPARKENWKQRLDRGIPKSARATNLKLVEMKGRVDRWETLTSVELNP